MKKKTVIILLTALLSINVGGIQAQESMGLSPEQQRHEKTLSDLRKQKEILEVKHAQAVLLRECQEMGIDCRSKSLSAIELSREDFLPSPSNTTLDIPKFDLPDTALLLSPSGKSDVTPELEAIQNQSAQLKHDGNSDWHVIGDKVGDWRVAYIDASKVRLIHVSDKSKIKTLVLRW